MGKNSTISGDSAFFYGAGRAVLPELTGRLSTGLAR
jgi:hypothetical protein